MDIQTQKPTLPKTNSFVCGSAPLGFPLRSVIRAKCETGVGHLIKIDSSVSVPVSRFQRCRFRRRTVLTRYFRFHLLFPDLFSRLYGAASALKHSMRQGTVLSTGPLGCELGIEPISGKHRAYGSKPETKGEARTRRLQMGQRFIESYRVLPESRSCKVSAVFVLLVE